MPYLWKEKKRGGAAEKGSDITPRGVMKDEALRQGRAEYERSKTERSEGRRGLAGVTTKTPRLRTCESSGGRRDPVGGTFKDVPFSEFLPVESGIFSCQWKQRGSMPDMIRRITSRDCSWGPRVPFSQAESHSPSVESRLPTIFASVLPPASTSCLGNCCSR